MASSFLWRGTTLETFQDSGNLWLLIERFIRWVITGTSWCLASLIIFEFIRSKPQDEDGRILEIIFNTVSGWTHFSFNEQSLLAMSFLRRLKGSPKLGVKFSLRFFTFLMKKSFMILARSLGLVSIDPFSISLDGGPPDDQPSQVLIFFQTVPVSAPYDLSFSSFHSFFSFLISSFIEFLSFL